MRYLLIILVLIVGKINAQKIIADRPDQTEGSSIVPKGSLQIESGMIVTFTEKDKQTEKQTLAPVTLFRYGITKGLELRILNQYEHIKKQGSIRDISGIGDLEIGTKIGFLKKEYLSTEIAFLSHLTIPTGTKNFTNNEFSTINKISISHQIGHDVGIGYNLGYNYTIGSKGVFLYSLSLGIGLTEIVSIYIESYGEFNNDYENLSNFDTGLTFLVTNNFQFDFSFGTGITRKMNYISMGISWNLRKEKK